MKNTGTGMRVAAESAGLRARPAALWIRALGLAMAVAGLCLALGIAGSPVAQAGAPDYSHVGAFLDIDMGTRAMGMGGAFVALADDPTALYYNPAGLAQISSKSLLSGFARLPAGINYGYAVVSLESLGVGGALLQAGDTRRDEYGEVIGNVLYADYAGFAGKGWQVGPLNLGVTGKVLVQNLPDYRDQGFAADVGALWVLDPVRLGVEVRNLLGGMRYGSFERTISLGAGSQLLGGDLSLAGQLDIPVSDAQAQAAKDNTSVIRSVFKVGTLRAGAEYRFGVVALRAGLYRRGAEPVGFTGGIGAQIDRFQVDYGYQSDPRLADTHRLSLAIQF
ncbi:MAG: PorV/PorQ family protein [Firmicutes bacterium]|nr:PorV/PorQ family protein [Bacillota bacterium]